MGTKFEAFLAEKLQDPAFKQGYDDARERSDLQRHLTSLRKARRVSQTEIGSRMGVGQSTVSEFETDLETDPRLSTLQRYARAVGVRLCWGIAADDSKADLSMFVPRTGDVDHAYRTSAIQWLQTGTKTRWPTMTRSHFAKCA